MSGRPKSPGFLRKKEVFRVISPIPKFVLRQQAIQILHTHSDIINIHPVLTAHRSIVSPSSAPVDERDSSWYEFTQRVEYIPGLKIKRDISFNGCFHDMPWGLQTHIYAWPKIDLRHRYEIAGNQSGIEPAKPLEIGLSSLGAPSEGLYLQIDVELSANIAIFPRVSSQVRLDAPVIAELIVKRLENLGTGASRSALPPIEESSIDHPDNNATPNDSSFAFKALGVSRSLPIQDLRYTSSRWPGHVPTESQEQAAELQAVPWTKSRPHNGHETICEESQVVDRTSHEHLIADKIDYRGNVSPSRELDLEGREHKQEAFEQTTRVPHTTKPEFFALAKMSLTANNNEADELPQAERRVLMILAEMKLAFASRQEASGLRFRTVKRREVLSCSDKLKLAVEASTDSEWNWWPFSAPVRWPDIQDRGTEISWEGMFGSRRREVLTPFHADVLSQVARICCEPVDAGTTPPASQESCSNRSVTDVGDLSSEDDHSTQNYSIKGNITSATSVTSSSSRESVIVALPGDDTKGFVFLMVMNTSRYVLTSIDVTKLTARDFFRTIVEKYEEKRGVWRRFFSIFAYSHCDFMKVQKYRRNQFSPLPGFSFPALQDKEYPEYVYKPQPMDVAPISKGMFYDLFHACYTDSTFRHKVHKRFPGLAHCDVVDFLPYELLDNMPKRDRNVLPEAQFRTIENIWALVAKEQRSALRVIIYMLLSLMPTVLFIFAWMFELGHVNDLSSAAVPVTVSMTILSMLWTVVYTRDEVRGDYC